LAIVAFDLGLMAVGRVVVAQPAERQPGRSSARVVLGGALGAETIQVAAGSYSGWP